MIDTGFIRLMARYNGWQNKSLYRAADSLSEAQRQSEQGAFFASIHGTLSHLFWGDSMWMHRFAGMEKPSGGIKESVRFVADWPALLERRNTLDQAIIEWSGRVDVDWLKGSVTWFSGAAGRDISKPAEALVVHFFNHQTHHRGQVHAMLTRLGAKPDETDLFLLPDA
jgi:uncharacterized damage-inducible protein DinB